MKLVYYYPLILVVVLFVGCQPESTKVANVPTSDSESEKATETDVDSSNEAESSKEFLIDVRTQEEWDSGHLSQAVHIPHGEVPDRIAEVTEDKSAKLVLY